MGFLKNTKGSVISDFFKPLHDLGPIKFFPVQNQAQGWNKTADLVPPSSRVVPLFWGPGELPALYRVKVLFQLVHPWYTCAQAANIEISTFITPTVPMYQLEQRF